jgi:putative nucleotidyltransferase with HDIG domain
MNKMDNLTENLAKYFGGSGHKLYEVGGSVRDRMLGKEPSDLDFTTDAIPEEIKRIITDSGVGHIYPLGEKFGTVGVLLDDGRKVEITTFRGDEKYVEGSRKPEVTFKKNVEEDLSRRDFTFNAMAYDAINKKLVDLSGGEEDLKNGIIRVVGSSKDRFSEDPLRMLRAARFASQLGFTKFDVDISEPEKLKHVSKERIAVELNKILLSEHPEIGLRAIRDFGMMEYVIPGIEKMYDMEQGPYHYKDVFNHTLDVVSKVSKLQYEPQDKLVLMLRALLHDIGKPLAITEEEGEIHFYGHERDSEDETTRILRDLRYDNKIVDRVARLVRYHMYPHTLKKEEDVTPRFCRRLINRVGRDDVLLFLDLARADDSSTKHPYENLYNKLDEMVSEELKEIGRAHV